jgi:anhydro-N-acetylmuramic acid kinase
MSPWEAVRRYAEKQERLVVGLMSGTSVDGVDAALVRISGSQRATQVELVAHTEHPFPPDLRERVLAVNHGEGHAEEVSRLNVLLAHLFADAVEAVLRVGQVSAQDVDMVASHGQTISHTPTTSLSEGHATLQIGDSSVIAYRTGIPVVADFRTADMAAGGQGAPLTPYADWCLLTHPTKTRCIQNIGGIGNVTYLPANALPGQVLGFDTGPGNMLIDRAAQFATNGTLTYDRHGELAASGVIHTDTLTWLLERPFLLQAPPKSAGREQFGESFFNFVQRDFFSEAPVNDIVATLAAFTAFSIADAYERYLPKMPDEVIVGGGGGRNPTLLKILREKLSTIPILTHEEMGINGDMKEAVAFALLANETMLGNPANLPSVTGAAHPVLLGKLTLP